MLFLCQIFYDTVQFFSQDGASLANIILTMDEVDQFLITAVLDKYKYKSCI